MAPASRSFQPLLLAIASVAFIAAVSIPALAAAPTASPGAAPAGTSTTPERGKPLRGPKAERGDKRAEVPGVEVTLTGTVGTRTTTDGEVEYTLTVGATTLTLDAGPSWFYGDKHPLAAFVGKTVTVVGDQATGSTVVDVLSVDGTVIRAAGKPPWAGGWKRVGKIHPGWSQEKWDKWQGKMAERGKRFGLDCWPPGFCRDANGKPITPGSSAQP
jgi:hypothetical protein